MAGFEVDPHELLTAAPKFLSAAEHLAGGATLGRAVVVSAHSLGTVEGAAGFAQAWQSFIDAHVADLDHGSVWVEAAGQAVRAAAELYQQQEDDLSATFDRIGGAGG